MTTDCPHRFWIAAAFYAAVVMLIIPAKAQGNRLRISAVWPHAGRVDITNYAASVALAGMQISTSDISHPNQSRTFTASHGSLGHNQTLVIVDDDSSFNHCPSGFGNCKFVDPDTLGITVPTANGPYSVGFGPFGSLSTFFQYVGSFGSTTGFTSSAATTASSLGMWTNPSVFSPFHFSMRKSIRRRLVQRDLPASRAQRFPNRRPLTCLELWYSLSAFAGHNGVVRTGLFAANSNRAKPPHLLRHRRFHRQAFHG
jgi:hypothetical protein